MPEIKRIYHAEPTIADFHLSSAPIRGIMGPIGSGKSVGCVIELATRARQQRPNRDGIRKTKWAVIRATYPELLSTTIPTFKQWLPESICPITYSPIITAKLQHRLADRTRVDSTFIFLSMSDIDIDKIKSLEVTGIWINEARELSKLVIDEAFSRRGRYPSEIDGYERGPGGESWIDWAGMIMDTNPPDDTHWWYRLAEEEKPEGWAFFRQPSALIEDHGKYRINPHAENVSHQPLGADYWLGQTAGKSTEWIRTMLMGEYGTIMDGKPIYSGSWSDTTHIRDDIKLIEKAGIICGWDWGLTPACVICQVTPRGRIHVLEEIIGDNIGVTQFAEGFVLPVLSKEYRHHSIIHIGDPAGGNREQSDERTVFEELETLGIRIEPAPNNSPLSRWEAVRHYLGQLIEGRPAFAMSPKCKLLRKGFNGGYRFRKLQVAGAERYSETAEKNQYSHAHDGLGYVCLYLRQNHVHVRVKKKHYPTAKCV